MKNYKILIILAVLLSSCAKAPIRPTTYPGGMPSVPITRSDLYHIVAPGETLWRIGKMYDVPINDIMRVNSLASSEKLERGQKLLIPNAAPVKPVITLYKSSKWKYIIVHHSATDEGNACSIFDIHSKRGFDGLGYHFIIDNGTCQKNDGQIETSPRWIKQLDGAHCKAAGMNHMGIGICLVGNFSKEKVSSKQMDSLEFLVDTLRRHYNIPVSNILGHSQVPGAKTECPGLYFPWIEFKKRISG